MKVIIFLFIILLFVHHDTIGQYTTYKKLTDNIQLYDMDEENLILDYNQPFRINDPALYIFMSSNKQFIIRNLIAGQYTFNKIKSSHVEFPQVEHYLNVIFFDTVELNINKKEIKPQIITESAKATDVEKKILLSIVQDAINTKIFFSERDNYIQLIDNKNEYKYNFLSSTFLTENDNTFYDDFISENIKNIRKLKNRYSEGLLKGKDDFIRIRDSLNYLKSIETDYYKNFPKDFIVPISIDKDFELRGIHLETYSLQKLISDKYTIIYFWGTWCAYCPKVSSEILPQILELIEDNHSIQLITIASESSDNLKEWVDYSHSKMSSYFNFVAPSKIPNRWSGSAMNDFFQYYSLVAFPNFMIVDHENNIILKNDTEGKHVIEFIKNNPKGKSNAKIFPVAIVMSCIVGFISYLVLLQKRRNF